MADQYRSLSPATLLLLSKQLSLLEMFRNADKNKDGYVPIADCLDIRKSLGCDHRIAQAPSEITVHITDKDGLVKLDEFLKMNTSGFNFGSVANHLRSALEALDAEDGDFVTGEELHRALDDMGIEMSMDECKDIIDSMDENGDGAVNFEDFKIIVNSLHHL